MADWHVELAVELVRLIALQGPLQTETLDVASVGYIHAFLLQGLIRNVLDYSRQLELICGLHIGKIAAVDNWVLKEHLDRVLGAEEDHAEGDGQEEDDDGPYDHFLLRAVPWAEVPVLPDDV